METTVLEKSWPKLVFLRTAPKAHFDAKLVLLHRMSYLTAVLLNFCLHRNRRSLLKCFRVFQKHSGHYNSEIPIIVFRYWRLFNNVSLIATSTLGDLWRDSNLVCSVDVTSGDLYFSQSLIEYLLIFALWLIMILWWFKTPMLRYTSLAGIICSMSSIKNTYSTYYKIVWRCESRSCSLTTVFHIVLRLCTHFGI